jgi:hypothetical protein
MANTPNYTILAEPSYDGILLGASTALTGIAQEAREAKKAQGAYNAFADQLEKEGLVADAAIYRGMAASETPNYLNAALTGKAATRNLEMPFQQALKLLDSKREEQAALERANLARQGLSVTERQGLRMEDSILSQDVSLANQELRDATRDEDRILENMARDSGNPALMELYTKQLQDARARKEQARKNLQAIQNQRRGVARQMSTAAPASGSSRATSKEPYAIEGAPDPGPLPVGGPSSPGVEASLVPLEGEGPPFSSMDGSVTEKPATETPEQSFVQARGTAFKREYEQAKRRFKDDPERLERIENAEDISVLRKIVAEAKKEVSIYKTPEEAVNAAKPYAPEGSVTIPKPLANGTGFTFGFVKKAAQVRRVNDRTWSNGEGDIWFIGEDNIIYHRMANQDPVDATMVQNEDGSAVTAATLQTWFNDLGIAYASGVTKTPPPKEINPTTKQNALNPTPNKVTVPMNPNTPQAAPTTPAKATMMDFNLYRAGGNK